MHRRDFLKLSGLSLPFLTSGCGLALVNPDHFLIRSDVIESLEQEAEIVSRARVEWTADKRIRILYVKGSPYERGYQHGKLLRVEIQQNLGFLYRQALRKFNVEELFDESYERMRPFIPEEYVEEMHGLAHGSELPLRLIHGIHALPEIGEWGGKKKIVKVVKAMMNGDFGTSCSNLCVQAGGTADGNMYVVRVLDWGLHRISKLHEYPLITVSRPEKGIPSANIGWIGFLGAISGMNAQGITLGEMGYKDPPNETLKGKPMPFLLRDVLSYATNLKDVREIISKSAGTNSFVFLMSDGKANDAELYVRDRERFVVFRQGENIKDKDVEIPALKDTVYGGHYISKMTEVLSANQGKITPEVLMKDVIPQIAMKSNFQNVIYDPKHLRFWVNNAASKEERAAEQPYSFFDLKDALNRF